MGLQGNSFISCNECKLSSFFTDIVFESKSFSCTEICILISDGLQELKIFVDLAYNATKDEEEILRVTSLQSSVNGYSSLIFDMNEGMNFKQLFENCEKVWKSLAEQPILPVQLVSCN